MLNMNYFPKINTRAEYAGLHLRGNKKKIVCANINKPQLSEVRTYHVLSMYLFSIIIKLDKVLVKHFDHFCNSW